MLEFINFNNRLLAKIRKNAIKTIDTLDGRHLVNVVRNTKMITLAFRLKICSQIGGLMYLLDFDSENLSSLIEKFLLQHQTL